jgi:outer membrane lipoprotein-sorting protein
MMIKMERHKRSLSGIALWALLLLTGGCVALPKAQVPFRPGATLETVAAMVTISVKTPQVNTGGHGYMVYQRPDRFHMVILTPFGTTALETYSSDDRLTIVIPSKGEAYAGAFDEMPIESPLRGWRMIRLMAVDEPLFDPVKKGTSEKSSKATGEITSFYDAQGLLERKKFSSGEEVFFRDYQSAEGVPFPSVIEFIDRNGARVKITFEEPEINKPVDNAALVPNLEGITILSLASFKGM